MKVLIVLSAVVAVSMAGYLNGAVYAPSAYAANHIYTPHVYAAPYAISSQHHAQDALGQYSYGYADGLSTKGEVKTVDGVTRGGYSYLDAEGKVQSVSYTADSVNGFRVAATNLPKAPEAPAADAPKPVEDTVEVAAAKSAHFAAIAQARAAAPGGAPQPVQETPEVASARAAHAAAHATASARAAIAPANYIHPGYYSYGPAGGFAYSSVAAAPAYTTYKYAGPIAAPVFLTAQGVPVDTPEVQAARAANTIAHIRAKANIIA